MFCYFAILSRACKVFFIPNVPCKPLLSTQNKCKPTCKTLVSPKYATQKHMFATFLRGNNSQCNKEETTGRDTEKRKTVIKEINSKHNKLRVVISSNK